MYVLIRLLAYYKKKKWKLQKWLNKRIQTFKIKMQIKGHEMPEETVAIYEDFVWLFGIRNVIKSKYSIKKTNMHIEIFVVGQSNPWMDEHCTA